MNEQLTHTVREFSTKETAAELRKALKAAFPGVKISVRMATGTAHGWFDISWTDGPMSEQVDAIANGFQSSWFDGRDDSYKSIEPTLYAAPDGSMYEPRFSCCGTNTHRSLSDVAQSWAASYAVPGTRWWLAAEHFGAGEPTYYAVRALLGGVDLTGGFPADPTTAWKDRWHR